MKAYKIEILIVDHDELGPEEIKQVIENTRYPNRCIMPQVQKIIQRDIGAWSDDHPLNNYGTMARAYQDIFGGDQ